LLLLANTRERRGRRHSGLRPRRPRDSGRGPQLHRSLCARPRPARPTISSSATARASRSANCVFP